MPHLQGPRAIVLDVGHPRAVAVMRSLARAGVEVYGIDHRPTATGFYSKYLSQRFLLDRDRDYKSELSRVLEVIAADGRGGILIPTADSANVFVAQNRVRLSQSFIVFSAPWSVLELTMDRAACYAVAAELGIATPENYVPKNREELDHLLLRLDFERGDYVLKTRVWDVPADVVRRRYTLVPEQNPVSFRQSWDEIAARSAVPPTIERIVPGDSDDCVGVSLVLNDDLEPVVAYCIRRLRMYTYKLGGRYQHPYRMGANVYCESIHDDEALEAALTLVRRIGYVGAITVEFRRDPETRVLTLIKFDPRVIRSLSLSANLGMDVPTALYRTFALGEKVEPCNYPDGVRWMWVSQYIAALRQHQKMRTLLAESLRLLANLTQVRAFGYLSFRDPLPFVKSVVPIERRRTRRLLRRLAGSRVLVSANRSWQ